MTKEIVIYILMFVEVILIALTAIQLNICYKKEQKLNEKSSPDYYGIFIPKNTQPNDIEYRLSKVTFPKDSEIAFIDVNSRNGIIEIQFEDIDPFLRAINILSREDITFYTEFTYHKHKEN